MLIKTFLLNLGCPKNQVDGEYFAGYLEQLDNILLINEYQNADLIIINTCGFIDSAKEESLEAILEAAEHKKTNTTKKLIVTGCLAQRYHQELEKEIPEIDGIFGIGEHEKIIDLIEEVNKGKRKINITEPGHFLNKSIPRKENDSHYAYLKIADGCDKGCTYCTIPAIKGGYSSRRIEYIIEEAKALVAAGVKELILVAQDTSLYGQDIYGERKLINLLTELVEIEDLKWIRIMYYYPEEVTRDLLEMMAEEDKICNYLDIPIQHVARDVRKKMGRPGDRESLKKKITLMRSIVPDLALRTTVMVGFPGETEADFAELVEFIEEIKFDKLGVFTYSRETGTPAAKMENQVSEKLKNIRYNKIKDVQQKISHDLNKRYLHRTLPAIIEEINDNKFIARPQYDAPEIDNYISGNFNREKHDLKPGNFISCKIIDAYEYDLIGEVIDEYP